MIHLNKIKTTKFHFRNSSLFCFFILLFFLFISVSFFQKKQSQKMKIFSSSGDKDFFLRRTEKLSPPFQLSIESLSSERNGNLKQITLRGRLMNFPMSSSPQIHFKWGIPENMEVVLGEDEGIWPLREGDFLGTTEIVLRETESSESSPKIFLEIDLGGSQEITHYDLYYQEQIEQATELLGERAKAYDKTSKNGNVFPEDKRRFFKEN